MFHSRSRSHGRAGGTVLSEHLTTDLELAEAMLANEIASSASVGRGNGNSEPALYGVAALASGDAVLQRLQTHLLGWFGPDGVDALLIRGLDRATAAHPILAAVQRPRGGALRLEGILDSVDATGLGFDLQGMIDRGMLDIM